MQDHLAEIEDNLEDAFKVLLIHGILSFPLVFLHQFANRQQKWNVFGLIRRKNKKHTHTYIRVRGRMPRAAHLISMRVWACVFGGCQRRLSGVARANVVSCQRVVVVSSPPVLVSCVETAWSYGPRWENRSLNLDKRPSLTCPGSRALHVGEEKLVLIL